MAFATELQVREQHGFIGENGFSGDLLLLATNPSPSTIRLSAQAFGIIELLKNGNDLPALNISGVAGTFVVAEVVTGGTSGATGTVTAVTATTVSLSGIVGTFAAAETITGGTSGATATVDSVDTFTHNQNSKDIILNIAAISGDEFSAVFESELNDRVLTAYLDQATAVVRSFLETKYGATLLDSWESPGPAPNLIIRYTTQLTGLYAERAMLRKGHSFKPEAMELLNDQEQTVLDALRDIEQGKNTIPGETGASDVLSGRTGAGHVFAFENDTQRVRHEQLDRRLGTDGRDLQPSLQSRRRREPGTVGGPIFDS